MSLSFVAEQTGGIDKGWHSKARNGGAKTLGGLPNGRSFQQGLAALAAQYFYARSDPGKIVCSAGLSGLATQLFHACPDHRKIVSGTGAGHASSVYYRDKFVSQAGL